MSRIISLLWMICFIFVMGLSIPSFISTAAANLNPSIDHSITLQEPPYSIGDGWILDTTFSSATPYDMAIGQKEYIVVGSYGTVMKSKDGIHWKALSKFKNYQLTTIASNKAQYVLFGAQAEYSFEASYTPSEAFISTDGLTWTKTNFPYKEAIQKVVWGNNQYVALGNKNVYTSKDGTNWTSSPLPQTGKFEWSSLMFVHDTYFITSYDDSYVLMSKDGEKWNIKKYPSSVEIENLIWVKDHYLGIGNGIYTSKDGVNWKKIEKSPTDVFLNTLSYDGQTYLITGYKENKGKDIHVSFTSKDGLNWKLNSLSNLPVSIYATYPVNGGFAGIGSDTEQDHPDGTYSMFSKDGIHWTTKIIGTSNSGDLNALATNGKRTVAVGLQGSVIYTDDGIHWNGGSPFANPEGYRPNLFDVVWDGRKFVAVGNGGVYYSSNAVSWNKTTSIHFKDQYGGLRNILWTGKFFIASDQVYGAYYSKDGIKWSQIKSISKPNYWLTSMIWDGKRVIGSLQIYNSKTGHYYTKLMQTTDGLKWNSVKDIDLSDTNLTYKKGHYVAINFYNPNVSWVSNDGLHWYKKQTNLNNDDNFEFITSIDNYFIAFNNSIGQVNGDYVTYNAYYTSTDGVKWKEIPVPDPHPGFDIHGDEMMKDGIKSHGKYIFVGGLGKIMYTNQLKK
mgnify:CR=1 FL=1